MLPVLLLFLLGIIDTGRLLWTYATLYRASEAAARCAAIHAANCTTFGKHSELCDRPGMGTYHPGIRIHGQQSGVRDAGSREL